MTKYMMEIDLDTDEGKIIDMTLDITSVIRNTLAEADSFHILVQDKNETAIFECRYHD